MTETLNTHQEPTGNEQAQHDAAMLAKAEQLEQNNNPDRPEWLPEKFESAEAMAQAYSQLERKLGSSYEADDDYDETVEFDSTEDMQDYVESEANEVAEALDEVGLDFNAFQEEFLELGGLSEDAYEALDEAGFSRDLVDSWIAGQQALGYQVQQDAFNMVGGQDAYADMIQWAADSLSPAEIDAFNANVESGDPSLMNFAIQGLYSRYRSEGSEPRLVQGQASNNQGGAFNSVAELTAAMRDPRYQNDPAYRQSVAQKLSRSNVF